MATACFLLVTFLPLRPAFNLPSFISRISVLTFLPAEGEYLRVDFFAEEELFLAAGLFLAAVFRLAEDFFAEEVFFCAADFVVAEDFL